MKKYLLFFFLLICLFNIKVVNAVTSDSLVMPDKYNTGFRDNGKITKVTSLSAQTINGILYKVGAGTTLIIELLYSNTSLGDTVVIENMDFSSFPFAIYNAEKTTKGKTIIFRNCKFSGFTSGRQGDISPVYFIFENCSFTTFSGSNATINNSYLGGTIGDALQLFQNVTIKNSYISNLSMYSDAGLHSDGVQIFGYNRDGQFVIANDIKFSNVRMEVPSLYTGGVAYVNACIMLSLDDNAADNITFENMYINGGGFSIYLQPKTFSFTNIALRNIKVGYSHKWGILYHGETNGAVYENVGYASTLYVGSVWEDSGRTHISVSNDTNINRTLRVETSSGKTYDFVIPKTYLKNELIEGVTFASFPIDLDKVIDEKVAWIKAYDITNASSPVLIRTQVLNNEFSVTFDENKGVSYNISNPSTSVVQGASYSFKIALLDGYTFDKLEVKVNDQVIETTTGVYTVNNVNSNIKISVLGLKTEKESTEEEKDEDKEIKEEIGTNDGVTITENDKGFIIDNKYIRKINYFFMKYYLPIILTASSVLLLSRISIIRKRNKI